MEQTQELPRIEVVGRRHGIRYDRGRLPPTSTGTIPGGGAPPATPDNIQINDANDKIEINDANDKVQVGT